MVHGLAQMFRTAARPQVHSMNAIPALKCRLRKTVDISRVGRTFQSVNTNDLAFRRRGRPMLVDKNAVFLIDSILFASRRKALFVNAPRPEIPGDGQKVRITEKWYEVALQIPIVAGLTALLGKVAFAA